jgi:hypothetical protein
MNISIHYTSSGQVIGATLWLPSSFIEQFIFTGQKEIEVSFEGNKIMIKKEDDSVESTPEVNKSSTKCTPSKVISSSNLKR